jgi:hypothetical protein
MLINYEIVFLRKALKGRNFNNPGFYPGILNVDETKGASTKGD